MIIDFNMNGNHKKNEFIHRLYWIKNSLKIKKLEDFFLYKKKSGISYESQRQSTSFSNTFIQSSFYHASQ